MIDGQWIEFEEVGQGYYHEERGTIWMDNETCTEWKSPGDYSLAKELGDLDDWYGGAKTVMMMPFRLTRILLRN